MRVAKWGNSLAIRLPVSVVEALELREGDEIEVSVDGPRLFTVRKKPGLQAKLERLHSFRGRLPADFKFPD
ncbi:AbrB/MazE/SpoVT family DNA-binding domain-containing protein [Xanthomonas citri pv. mangiferaeindicae]|uniref:AbrB/MazE/SpoVT family DNA-binding domain-containing protein n=2 Tax=Xanthomonas citri TaxID=346 RepID=UPI00099866AA|nr:AbrB/MazE/SpoVT family DNA-binding domain-containing protein [Xanthomonas citri]OOW60366.1 AbrB family transcriptional regulator [Xanthomonas campestris pv. centellae]UDB89708.1 AbrB/MazE/SpoVT family DNA-binding domain-containing protein [Xanthomonas citri pv. mangiferaeindicae]